MSFGVKAVDVNISNPYAIDASVPLLPAPASWHPKHAAVKSFHFVLSRQMIFKFLIPCFLLVNLLSAVQFASVIKARSSAPDVVPAGYFAAVPEVQVENQELYEPYWAGFPQIDDYASKSVLVYDNTANRAIYEKNTSSRTLIASLTKLVSAKVLHDNINPNKVVSINEEVEKIGGSSLVLKKDEIFKSSDLIKAAIISSSNQAMFAVQDEKVTIAQMNEYVESLGLKNTNFANPAGFDDSNNYSTAKDLLVISKNFFKDPVLKKYASTITEDIQNINEGKKHRLVNTNDLLTLRTPGIVAGKTGTTGLAGQNLILLVQKNGREYIIILLNGNDRYDDAYKVLGRL